MKKKQDKVRKDFFEYFRGRDRKDPSSGKYITLMELWAWIEKALQSERKRK